MRGAHGHILFYLRHRRWDRTICNVAPLAPLAIALVHKALTTPATQPAASAPVQSPGVGCRSVTSRRDQCGHPRLWRGHGVHCFLSDAVQRPFCQLVVRFQTQRFPDAEAARSPVPSADSRKATRRACSTLSQAARRPSWPRVEQTASETPPAIRSVPPMTRSEPHLAQLRSKAGVNMSFVDSQLAMRYLMKADY